MKEFLSFRSWRGNYIFQGMVPTPLSPWVSVSGVNNRSVVPQTARGRQSVRLESKRRYNEGLFIITLSHAPVSCGSWPALWMFGSLGWLKLWDVWGGFGLRNDFLNGEI